MASSTRNPESPGNSFEKGEAGWQAIRARPSDEIPASRMKSSLLKFVLWFELLAAIFATWYFADLFSESARIHYGAGFYGFFGVAVASVGGGSALLTYSVLKAFGLHGAPPKETHGLVTAKYSVADAASRILTIEVRLEESGEKVRLTVERAVFDSIDQGQHVRLTYRFSPISGERLWDPVVQRI